MSSTDGSSTVTGEKRRASAESRSILRYSASVVAPITRSSPRASSGLRMLAASIAPSGAPAPSTVCSSSRNRTILPSDSTASSSAFLRRFSNWPRNWAPAIMPDRSSATIRVLCERLGDLVAVDAQGQALRDGGLADAGLADQHGVVLAPAGEDLDGLGDLVGTADDRVDTAGGRIGRQVTAELVERGLALGAGGSRPRPRTSRTAPPRAARRPRRTPSAPCPAAGRRRLSMGWVLKISVTVTEISDWLHTQCDRAHASGRFPRRDLPPDRPRGSRAARRTWSATRTRASRRSIDPRLEIGEYLRLARYLGVSIEHILETHNHADHVSGHGRLAAATGALIHVHALAEAEYEHEPFEDGWELRAGRRASCARCTRPGTGPSTRRSR